MHQWFNGPDFLWQQNIEDVNFEEYSSSVPDNDPEIRKAVTVLTTKVDESSHLLSCMEERLSSWSRMTRVTAYILRFIANCRIKSSSSLASLSTTEIQTATITLLKLAQEKYFRPEILICNKANPSHTHKKKDIRLWRLDPFIAKDGLLRAGGRLKRSLLNDNAKHPVILPKKCVLSRRLVEHYHKNVKHCGRTTTTNALRQDGYWIVNCNGMVRSVINQWVPCRALRGKVGEQQMSELPIERFSIEGPFTYTGVDMFGPFYIREGRKEMKRFVALFTCLSSRAVHLESTNSMDTNSFIQALRRFVSRRGSVKKLFSDNGTNFVGAANEWKRAFQKMDHSKISDFLLDQSCDWVEWQRMPPSASHFGGVWERQIRSVRNIMSAMLRDHCSRLDDESFRTLLAEAELIVNSRPLTIENLHDPSSLPLTPMNILTTKTKVVLPPPGVFQREDVYCRKRWRQVQHLANEFWSRWQKEYLSTLQSRQKWLHKKRNFEPNDIVLVKDENLPRNQWPLARVTKTFPDPTDNLVRKVQLFSPTSKSELMRPVQKLVLLVEGVDTVLNV